MLTTDNRKQTSSTPRRTKTMLTNSEEECATASNGDTYAAKQSPSLGPHRPIVNMQRAEMARVIVDPGFSRARHERRFRWPTPGTGKRSTAQYEQAFS